MDTRLNKYSTTQVWEITGWIAVTGFFLLAILYLVPYYAPWYRVPVNLLNTFLFFESMAVIAFVLIPLYLYKKRYYRCVTCIVLGLLIFVTAKHTPDWRIQLTEKLIQTYYCREDKVYSKGNLLIGITNCGGVFINEFPCLYVTSEKMMCASMGLQINDSQYPMFSFDEEFFYCDKEVERQSQNRQ